MSVLRKGDISEKGRAASLKLFVDRYFHLKCSYYKGTGKALSGTISGFMLKVWESKRVEVGKRFYELNLVATEVEFPRGKISNNARLLVYRKRDETFGLTVLSE